MLRIPGDWPQSRQEALLQLLAENGWRIDVADRSGADRYLTLTAEGDDRYYYVSNPDDPRVYWSREFDGMWHVPFPGGGQVTAAPCGLLPATV